ncbi:hypothetical protein IAQ61_001404 [Plenodomus lingam]|nr:hypothetical protein IAQ61_001404 [Plenodomus lingam]
MTTGLKRAQNDLPNTETNLNDHVDSGFADMRKTDSIEHAQEKLLRSLEFTEQFTRYNAIKEKFENTFEWIYDSEQQQAKSESGTISRRCSQKLKDWLVSDQPLFWIQGKPGSGKSTLVKFLYEDGRTRDILQKQDPKAIVVSAYL